MNPKNIIGGCARLLDRCRQSVSTGHRDLPGPGQPRNGVLVIDASGSMYATDWPPTRLGAAQQAAKTFVKRLLSEEADARVAVVAYGSDAVLLCDLTPVKSHSKLDQSIDSICDMGCTNITAGLEIAYDLLEHSQRNGQVVLLTDGCHNTGPDPKPISDKLRECAIVECIGIGGSPANVDEKLLRYLASRYPDGSKRYRWIGDKQNLVRHFHNLAGRIVRA